MRIFYLFITFNILLQDMPGPAVGLGKREKRARERERARERASERESEKQETGNEWQGVESEREAHTERRRRARARERERKGGGGREKMAWAQGLQGGANLRVARPRRPIKFTLYRNIV